MGTYFDVAYMLRSFPTLISYVHITVFITLLSAVVGVLLGSVIAVIRINNVRGFKELLTVFVSFMRGTPFLVQLFLVYFGVPEILSHMGFHVRNVPALLFVLVVFTLHVAAYGSEIMRSSIKAVSAGKKKRLPAWA